MKKLLNTKIKDMKAITLIALVITIVVLIILAAVAITLSLGNNGLLNRSKTAKELYTNSHILEDSEISQVGNEIDVLSSSSRLTGSSGKKTIIWKTTQTGIREVNLNDYNCKITDFDFLIVFYNTGNSSGSMIMDTTANYTYCTDYTYGNNYVFGYISTDIENNKVTTSVSGNQSTWTSTSYSYLTMIIGINL